MTPLRGLFSYNKHNVNGSLGMMGLNPNQQLPNALSRTICTGMVKGSPVLPVPQEELWQLSHTSCGKQPICHPGIDLLFPEELVSPPVWGLQGTMLSNCLFGSTLLPPFRFSI